jgi:hypothetical protein
MFLASHGVPKLGLVIATMVGEDGAESDAFFGQYRRQ